MSLWPTDQESIDAGDDEQPAACGEEGYKVRQENFLTSGQRGGLGRALLLSRGHVFCQEAHAWVSLPVHCQVLV